MEHKLIKKIVIKGKIVTLTGLHIGGTNSAMGIGGPDSMVVRNPIDNKPYIPGSSLKGKLRAMLDITEGTISSVPQDRNVQHPTTQNPEDPSVKLFGNAPRKKDVDKQGEQFSQIPSRVIFRDGKLLGSEEELERKFKNTDLPYTESKTEVVIDRITAKATPRQLERVPAGAEFELNMVLNVFEGDDEEKQIKNLERAMKLLEDDYLGGSGSRGYGQIKFIVEKVLEKNMDYYKEGEDPKTITEYFKDFR